MAISNIVCSTVKLEVTENWKTLKYMYFVLSILVCNSAERSESTFSFYYLRAAQNGQFPHWSMSCMDFMFRGHFYASISALSLRIEKVHFDVFICISNQNGINVLVISSNFTMHFRPTSSSILSLPFLWALFTCIESW